MFHGGAMVRAAGRAPGEPRRFMKFMRRLSCREGCLAIGLAPMIASKLKTGPPGIRFAVPLGTAPVNPPLKETHMAWQKPQATDLRYGFEITMYISNR
jgi:pyrroloquinoline quinone biosynthesis protein A